MRSSPAMIIITGILALALAGCGDSSKLPEQASHGPNPTIPEPVTSLIPTLHVAKAVGWPEGVKPKPAAGMNVNAFASGFDHPRWVYVLPNGDVLVAESNAPPKEQGGSGPRAWAQSIVMWWAGAKPKSANRITLVRDKDGDGVGETKTVFLKDLMSPFGMALIGDNLYVANADAIVRFKYTEGATEITAPAEKVTDLPGGPLNHHWTKNILPSKDGKKLFATVGSNSNAAENGMEAENMRAAILEVDLANGNKRVFGAGLRNPNGMGLEPTTGELWTVVNERDELGSDLVPDYLTSVKDGGFYGWPYSYWGKHVDTRVKPQNPELVAKAIVPDYALGNHVAPLGMTFAQTSEGNTVKLPQQFLSGVFVGEHGSWNRKPLSGYKVVFVPFANGKPSANLPLDVLTGFISDEGKALGRPVGVTVAKDGALLVADDVGNVIWRVTAGAQTSAK
ncbi:MAG: sorbosone dehydrogenase family protein [Pseudolabrys sp.]|nr:sorbosone dehydrogenase family protein [Pseudolabrys sp.]